MFKFQMYTHIFSLLESKTKVQRQELAVKIDELLEINFSLSEVENMSRRHLMPSNKNMSPGKKLFIRDVTHPLGDQGEAL